MIFSNLLESYLIEMIIKVKGGYKVKSHITGKVYPKLYKNKRDAISRILGMKSKGGFYNKSKEEQEKMITKYLKRN